MVTLLERFNGEKGRSALAEALLKQRLFAADKKLIQDVIDVARLETFHPEEALITEGETDNSIMFIVAGSVSVIRSGRPGPIRRPGDYVGELTLLDPTTLRSATVVAVDETVVVQVTEPQFKQLCDTRPELWRALAIDVAYRLRQRLDDVSVRNDRSQVFIGSTREALDIAEALQSNLTHLNADVKIWTQGVFQSSYATLESLEEQARKCDFAIIILTDEDEVSSRGKSERAPRDNVVFELGLFIGSLGRKRVFGVKKRSSPLKVPTDLLGITLLEFSDGGGLEASLGPVATKIKQRISKLGAK